MCEMTLSIAPIVHGDNAKNCSHRLAGELELDSTPQAAAGRRHLSPP
jgi:hypothetical protein